MKDIHKWPLGRLTEACGGGQGRFPSHSDETGLFQKIAKLSLEVTIFQVGRKGNCKIGPLNRFVVGLNSGQPSL